MRCAPKKIDTTLDNVHDMFSSWLRQRSDNGRVMFLVHNEQTKFTATWLNTMGTALVAAGTFGPFAAQLYGLASPIADRVFLAVAAGVCFVVGVGLHLGGRVFLRRLRE
jgi:hypothetical protein